MIRLKVIWLLILNCWLIIGGNAGENFAQMVNEYTLLADESGNNGKGDLDDAQRRDRYHHLEKAISDYVAAHPREVLRQILAFPPQWMHQVTWMVHGALVDTGNESIIRDLVAGILTSRYLSYRNSGLYTLCSCKDPQGKVCAAVLAYLKAHQDDMADFEIDNVMDYLADVPTEKKRDFDYRELEKIVPASGRHYGNDIYREYVNWQICNRPWAEVREKVFTVLNDEYADTTLVIAMLARIGVRISRAHMLLRYGLPNDKGLATILLAIPDDDIARIKDFTLKRRYLFKGFWEEKTPFYARCLGAQQLLALLTLLPSMKEEKQRLLTIYCEDAPFRQVMLLGRHPEFAFVRREPVYQKLISDRLAAEIDGCDNKGYALGILDVTFLDVRRFCKALKDDPEVDPAWREKIEGMLRKFICGG